MCPKKSLRGHCRDDDDDGDDGDDNNTNNNNNAIFGFLYVENGRCSISFRFAASCQPVSLLG